MLLKLLDVSCSYGSWPVLKGINFAVGQGEIMGIVGPNGSGKSTLLRTMSRVLPPRQGTVMLQDRDLYKIEARQVAGQLAFVAQESGNDFPFTVEDTVMMGRIPHLKRFQREGLRDQEVVDKALHLTDAYHLTGRLITELSGGEKQRIIIARALAQEPRVLFLDEPTSFLDINYQIEIMELLNRLRRDQGLTVIMVVHDLNLASHYCDSILVLKEGAVYAAGHPAQVLSADLIQEVYGCRVQVEYRSPDARPTIVFNPNRKRFSQAEPRTVHVVGGGGSCGRLYNDLNDRGWKVSTGVLNIGDSDWHDAVRLGLKIAETAPFSDISPESAEYNRRLMQEADFVILPGIPFGSGNLANLQALLDLAREGRRVIVIDNQAIEDRDYTGGCATNLYKSLLKHAYRRVSGENAALDIIEGEANDAVPS
ncbi:MAG: ABC transporter ATP-binding protein [Syntrophomonas sp.]